MWNAYAPPMEHQLSTRWKVTPTREEIAPPTQKRQSDYGEKVVPLSSPITYMEMDTKKITQEPYDKADLEEAVETMRRGGIILYPTDTVWGIGCDATNEEAVRRIYELKRREDSKSMLVLVGETYEVERLVKEIPEVAYDLMELAVRPITIIYPNASGVAPNLLGEDNSLGIRQSRELFSSALCKRLRRPIVSTSANISGEPTPLFFSGISPEIIAGVDYVVKYRQGDETPREPSQIIMLGPTGEVKVLRP